MELAIGLGAVAVLAVVFLLAARKKSENGVVDPRSKPKGPPERDVPVRRAGERSVAVPDPAPAPEPASGDGGDPHEAPPEAASAVDRQKVFSEIRRVDGSPSYGFDDRVQLTLALQTVEGEPAADRFIEVRLFWQEGDQLKGGPPPGFEAKSDRTNDAGEYRAEFDVPETFHGKELSGQVLTIYANSQKITGTGLPTRPIIAPDPDL